MTGGHQHEKTLCDRTKTMHEVSPEFRPQPRLGTSEDIPRAIEYLIQRVLQFVSFGTSAVLGLVAFSAFWHEWSLWIVIPVVLLACAAFLAGISIRPRVKVIFDAHGPIIVVPRPQTPVVESSAPPNEKNS
jgi:VIT1/CCC1 family predicted Fe2+/Mn2+ transporter